MVSKTERKASKTPTTTTEQPSVQTKRVGTIKVLKTDAKFRGAREAWYQKLKEMDGKPIADYEEATTKTPPSLPKSGKAEKPSGWIGYFQRTGILAVVQPKA
jgi:hypothetical protein